MEGKEVEESIMVGQEHCNPGGLFSLPQLAFLAGRWRTRRAGASARKLTSKRVTDRASSSYFASILPFDCSSGILFVANSWTENDRSL